MSDPHVPDAAFMTQDDILRILDGFRSEIGEKDYEIAKDTLLNFHSVLLPAMNAIDEVLTGRTGDSITARAMRAVLIGGMLGYIEGKEPEIFETYMKGRCELLSSKE